MKNAIRNGYITAVVSQVVLILVGLWTTRIILETLGAQTFGDWIICCQILSFFTLGDLGIGASLSRAISAAPQNRINEYTTTAFYLLFFLAFCLAIIAFCTINLLPGIWSGARIPLIWVLSIYIATFPLRIFQSTLFGLQDFSWSSVLSAVGVLVGLAVTIALLKMSYGIAGPIAGWTVTQMVVLLGSAWRILAKFPFAFVSLNKRLCANELLEEIKHGVAVSAWTASQIFSQAADVLFIGYTLGASMAAQYALVVKLPQIIAGICTPLTRMSLPQLTIAYTSNCDKGFSEVRRRLFYTQSLLAGFMAILVVYANPVFIEAWIGRSIVSDDFITLTPAFAIMGLIRQLSQNTTTQLQSMGKSKAMGILQVLYVCVLTLISFLLLPKIGPIAMPIAATLAELLVLILSAKLIGDNSTVKNNSHYAEAIRTWATFFSISFLMSLVAFRLIGETEILKEGVLLYLSSGICLLVTTLFYLLPQREAIQMLRNIQTSCITE